jgi:signal transduction histidine kinase
MATVLPRERNGSAALIGSRASASLFGPTVLERVTSLFQFAVRNYRWLLFVIPVYVVLTHGIAAWPLAASLAAAALSYNATFSLAEAHWPDWVASRTLYLRCIEIGLVCIGLSLLYVWSGGLENQFYYDGFYAVFVVLASLSAGRRGVLISASLAALAVCVGQAMGAPDAPVILTAAGIEYWISVLIYSGTFGLFFVAIGSIAHLSTDFEAHRAAEHRGALERSAAVRRNGSVRGHIVEVTAHRERLATLGEVTARVIHGLSNPLTGISTLVDHLIESGNGNGDTEALQLVKTEAERATTMVRELLVFARRDTPDSLVSINDVAERALALWELTDPENNVKVVREFTTEPLFISGRASQLEQAVLNLLENARHALDGCNDCRITVRTRREEDRVILEVADNGPGVADELQGYIFEPFFTTKEPGSGTGLGLAIVKTVVAESDGSVTLTSRPGAGATFSLSFRKLG